MGELLNFSDPSYNTLKYGVDACTDEKTELEGQHFLAMSPWASCTGLHFTGPQCHHKSNNGEAMAPHSSTLAWKIPWMEEPGGLQSMGSLRVGHD